MNGIAPVIGLTPEPELQLPLKGVPHQPGRSRVAGVLQVEPPTGRDMAEVDGVGAEPVDAQPGDSRVFMRTVIEHPGMRQKVTGNAVRGVGPNEQTIRLRRHPAEVADQLPERSTDHAVPWVIFVRAEETVEQERLELLLSATRGVQGDLAPGAAAAEHLLRKIQKPSACLKGSLVVSVWHGRLIRDYNPDCGRM
ncbi:hypothetical protein ACQ9ZG_28250 [Streptomyces araujoniae]|uniref:hypothetical protein n=1 Tax=Streptomyces sp. ZEA17I TaxID=2202516 RepID=UPI0011B35C0D|nr:hypothetical protein [Streptomyces sp. ZEA17I]